jgi:hypothetical protein
MTEFDGVRKNLNQASIEAILQFAMHRSQRTVADDHGGVSVPKLWSSIFDRFSSVPLKPGMSEHERKWVKS